MLKEWTKLVRGCGRLDEARELHSRIQASRQLLPPGTDPFLSNTIIDMYGRCGGVDDARRVFDAMDDKNAFTLISMLRACVKNGRFADAEVVFLESSPKLHSVVSSTTMLSCYASQGKVEQATMVFEAIEDPNVVSWTAMLTCYAQNAQVSEAKACFDAMPVRNVVSWTVMVAAFAQAGHLLEAVGVFRRMPCSDPFSCTTAVEAYGRLGDLDVARELYAALGDERTEVTDNTLLSVLGCNGRVEEAMVVFAEMERRSIVSWTALLSAYAGARHLQQAEMIFHKMPSWNAVSWTALLTAYTQSGRSEETKARFDAMPEKNVIVNGLMVKAMMMTDSQPLDQAMGFFCSMERRDLVCWTVLLHGFAQRGDVHQSKLVFDKMPWWNLVAWTAMMGSHAQAGNIEQAKQLFYEMPVHDVVSWNTLVTAFSKSGHVLEARETLERIPQRNLSTWNSVLSGYVQHGETEQAKEFFESMLLHDEVSWNVMLAAVAREGKLWRVMCLLHTMVNQGFNPDNVSFVSILLACSHCGTLDDARSCFTSMVSDHGVVPVQDHYCCMVDAMGRAGHLDQAEELIQDMPGPANAVSWRSLSGACRSHQDVERGERVARHLLYGLDPASEVGSPYVTLSDFLRSSQNS